MFAQSVSVRIVVDNQQIFDYINDLRKESKKEHELLHKRISDMKDELLAEMKEIRNEQAAVNRRMDNRVTALERWKWTIVGGAIVLGFVLSGGVEAIRNLLS
jgi:hypothetical protein